MHGGLPLGPYEHIHRGVQQPGRFGSKYSSDSMARGGIIGGTGMGGNIGMNMDIGSTHERRINSGDER